MTIDTPSGRSGADVQWTVCPVTLNALALVSDAAIGTMLNHPGGWRSTSTKFEIAADELHPDTRHLVAPIAAITFRAWAHGRFTVELQLTQADGAILRFVDQDFAGIGLLPATILTALHGKPLTAYCDHPVFEGVVFDQSDDLGAPRAPISSIPVDGRLGERIRARRATLLERRPAPSPGEAPCESDGNGTRAAIAQEPSP